MQPSREVYRDSLCFGALVDHRQIAIEAKKRRR
jgi:hypothetical protein